MQCPHCQKQFATHDGLSRHVVVKHGKAAPPPPPTPEEIWQDFCDVVFGSRLAAPRKE